MQIDILTLFPSMFQGPFNESMVKKAQEKEIVTINIHDLRDWSTDKRRTVDDRPYGGGKGMILKVDVLDRALTDLKQTDKNSKTILLSPQGKTYNQQTAFQISQLKHLILICGHYEGFDERIKNFVDQELSIGNYILTGGEIPAMVVVDSVVRLLPGVLDPEAVVNESFSISKNQAFDFPQYTRPIEYQGYRVPDILLSGDHQKIEQWRQREIEKKSKKG
jgi:tRNA (guanine37-N1)-methyltransferase